MQRRPDVIFSEIEQEIVALDIDQGNCFGFNEVAARVWQLLDQPRSIDELCNVLLREYDVDEATCRAEISALLNKLNDERLLIV